MSLWKGFIPIRGKRSLIKFKDVGENELLTQEDADRYPEYGGVLSDNTVLIDVDDMEQANTLLRIVQDLELKCRVITTGRGMHFLFWNNGQISKNVTHRKVAVGLTVDIKLGSRCSYEVLKRDGVVRETVYDTGEYETVPRFLTPINTSIELFGLGEGDGRNQALFSYILPLQKARFSVDEIRELLKMVNQYLFKIPLGDSELDTVMRDGAFTKVSFFDGDKFEFDKFARWLVANKHIIKIDGDLHVYRNGIYVAGDEALAATMIEEIPNLRKIQRTEVLDYINLLEVRNYKSPDVEYVAFQNGVLNIIEGTFGDFDPSKIITNKIPHDYVPEARSELLEKTMHKLACGDENVLKLLYESLSYSLFKQNELRKSFFLLGTKRNGKSTYLDLLSTMLGDDNISTLDLCDLSSEFKTAEIMGKLANIGDDISDEFISNTAIFKKVVSGESITVNRKFKKPIQMTSRAKFYFSANSLPRLGRGKDTAAIIDRLVIIPFNATFTKDDPDFDPFIKYKLRKEEVVEALIVKCVEALRRVLENEAFTYCPIVEREIKDFEQINNPITLFFEDLEEADYLNNPTDIVYKKYTGFCYTNNLTPCSNIEFSKQIRKKFGLVVKQRRIDGKRCRFFVKDDYKK